MIMSECKGKEVEINKCKTERIIVDQLQKNIKLTEQKIDIERNMFVQEAGNIDRVIKDDDKGYLRIRIGTYLNDLKHRLEKCNEVYLTYLAASEGQIAQQKPEWIKEL